MFCRMAEVYAGFSEYTDAQVGRIVDYLEESGQLENTIIFYCADNGASGEGSPNGSVNEGKIFDGYPDDLEQNLHDGGPARGRRTPTTTTRPAGPRRSRRPTGCSSATPTRAACATRWSSTGRRGSQARGEVRHQYHHCTDIVPTIYEACGVDDARGLRRLRADAAVRRLDGLLLQRRGGADREEDAVLRDARQPWHLARGLEGGRRARPDQRHQWVRQGRAGSSSTPTWTGPRLTTSLPRSRRSWRR